jgi:hypothetical protein
MCGKKSRIGGTRHILGQLEPDGSILIGAHCLDRMKRESRPLSPSSIPGRYWSHAFMAVILLFPTCHRYPRKSSIILTIVDTNHPEITRVGVQRVIVNAAGFPSLKGLTDRAARLQRSHPFTVSRRYMSRFIRQVRPLVREGLVRVTINGGRITVRKAA